MKPIFLLGTALLFSSFARCDVFIPINPAETKWNGMAIWSWDPNRTGKLMYVIPETIKPVTSRTGQNMTLSIDLTDNVSSGSSTKTTDVRTKLHALLFEGNAGEVGSGISKSFQQEVAFTLTFVRRGDGEVFSPAQLESPGVKLSETFNTWLRENAGNLKGADLDRLIKWKYGTHVIVGTVNAFTAETTFRLRFSRFDQVSDFTRDMAVSYKTVNSFTAKVTRFMEQHNNSLSVSVSTNAPPVAGLPFPTPSKALTQPEEVAQYANSVANWCTTAVANSNTVGTLQYYLARSVNDMPYYSSIPGSPSAAEDTSDTRELDEMLAWSAYCVRWSHWLEDSGDPVWLNSDGKKLYVTAKSDVDNFLKNLREAFNQYVNKGMKSAEISEKLFKPLSTELESLPVPRINLVTDWIGQNYFSLGIIDLGPARYVNVPAVGTTYFERIACIAVKNSNPNTFSRIIYGAPEMQTAKANYGKGADGTGGTGYLDGPAYTPGMNGPIFYSHLIDKLNQSPIGDKITHNLEKTEGERRVLGLFSFIRNDIQADNSKAGDISIRLFIPASDGRPSRTVAEVNAGSDAVDL